MSVTLDVKFDPAEWKGFLDVARATTAVNDVYVSQATKYMAWGAAKGLGYLLSRRVNGIKVSATGKSAVNLFVAALHGGGLHADSHAVYEGNITSGNYYIRAGSPPQKQPPMQKILAWMQAKGMGEFSGASSAPLLTGGTPASKRGFKGKSNQSDAERIAWGIAKTIAKKGTSTAHKPLFPGNQRRYDYVAYAVQRLNMVNELFKQLEKQGLPRLHSTMVGYWKTGRWNKGGSFNQMRPKIKL